MVVEKNKMEFFSKKCCLEIYIKQPRCYRNPGYSTCIDVMLLNSLIVSKANVFSRQAELIFIQGLWILWENVSLKNSQEP